MKKILTAICSSPRYDFFLVSQSVTQGTVNPTSYNVIHDTSGLQPKHVQMLTYKLCHLYYNWPGGVRVPSVCQYAHKLGFLIGNSVHKQHHEVRAFQSRLGNLEFSYLFPRSNVEIILSNSRSGNRIGFTLVDGLANDPGK